MTTATKEQKTFTGELKSDDSGTLTAIFSRFNVIDSDGDVTRPSAFVDGTDVIIGAFGHRTSEPPIGKGKIRVSPTVATVEGRLFLDTTHGRDAYNTLKQLGPMGSWSYVFTVLQESRGDFEGKRVRFLEKVKVFSVDPVLAGAGVGTFTTSIKCADCAAKEPAPSCGCEPPDLATTIAEAKATLEQLDRLDAGRAIREAQKTLRELEYVEVPDTDIPIEYRTVVIAALEAAKGRLLADKLPAVKYFRTGPAGDPLVWGRARIISDEIWIKADLPDRDAVTMVAMHEFAHAMGFNESYAQEFGDLMLAEQKAKNAYWKVYDAARPGSVERIPRIRFEGWNAKECREHIAYLEDETAKLRRRR